MQFYRWLDEPIATGHDEKMPRKDVITLFVNQGLYPWVTHNGWNWAITSKDLKNQIATGLFINQRKHTFSSNWRFKSYNTDYHEEYKNRFDHIFSPERWEQFWSIWGSWDDVNPSTDYGSHRRIDIQNCIWPQINLNTSPEAIVVDEILFDEDDLNLMSSSTTKRESDDIYLYESAESGQYGGYRK